MTASRKEQPRARTSGTHSQLRQCHDQRLSLDAGEGEVQVSGPAVFSIAIQRDIGKLLHDAIVKVVGILLNPLVILLHLVLAQFRSLSKSLVVIANMHRSPPRAAWAAFRICNRAPGRRPT